MPQYRKLYAKIRDSQDVNDMPDDFTRLLWTWLPLILDREGRGIFNATWVKSKTFPLREDITNERVAEALVWFMEHGMIVMYRVNQRNYFYVPTFHDHQGDTSKEAASLFPAPPAPDQVPQDGEDLPETTPDPLQSDSGVTPDLVESRSTSDADADADAYSDTEERESAANAAPSPEPFLEGQGLQAPVMPLPDPDCEDPTPDQPGSYLDAVVAYHQATGQNPPKESYELISQVLTAQPDLERLRQVFQAWVSAGYKKRNVAGILDWYKGGIPTGPPGKGPPASRTRTVFDGDGNPVEVPV